uniref:De novo designed IL-6 mimetic n=1 Tax=synthetic construct TaxID=32630 RepID=UPI00355C9F15
DISERFRRLMRRADELARRGNPEEARKVLEEAEELMERYGSPELLESVRMLLEVLG